jgi:hypothetical protein
MTKRSPVFRKVLELVFTTRNLALEARELDLRVRGLGLETLERLLRVRLLDLPVLELPDEVQEVDVEVLELDAGPSLRDDPAGARGFCQARNLSTDGIALSQLVVAATKLPSHGRASLVT